MLINYNINSKYAEEKVESQCTKIVVQLIFSDDHVADIAVYVIAYVCFGVMT